VDLLKVIYRALTRSVPVTLLNLVLIPMVFYYGHKLNPSLILGVLLLHYILSKFTSIVERHIELEQKRLFGFTPNELFKKVLTGVTDELDKTGDGSSETHN